ncbi:transcriptional regulator [Staphylococcus borealis]|uniref:transcriptional regulator n=1 Tax=Staphylococcus borealis TaxID=2742203 RepID=UPI00211C30F6|nr:transcriptional regulator [Staphylococcus borealis]MCQ9279779.1 transcriptional regulator [Staphylococcus borealis]
MKIAYPIRKATFKYIESEVYHLEESKREIRNIREEILNPYKHRNINAFKSKSKYAHTSITEIQATLLLSNKLLNNLENNVKAIEKVYSRLPEDRKKVIDLKYFNKDSKLKLEQIADMCFMHRNTVSTIKQNFIKSIAIELGII